MANFSQTSLRTRFILGLVAMLLPLVLLSLAVYFSLQSTTSTFKEALEKSTKGMHSVMHLQISVLQAVMPPNDYLIYGGSVERDKFFRLGTETDQDFKNALALPVLSPEERASIESARKEWLQARQIAENLLALAHPVGNPDATRNMQRMDAHIDRAVEIMQRAHILIKLETNEQLALAQAVERRAIFLLTTMFGLGLVIVIGGGVMLIRSFLIPLHMLKESAKSFGAGEFSYRADTEVMPVELGQLAAAFNAMATRLEKNHAVLEQRASRLSALNHISMAINSSALSLQEILDEIMRKGVRLIGANASCIAFYDSDERRFKNWVTYGLSEHFTRNMSFIQGGLADETFTNANYILSNDRPDTLYKLSKLAREEGLQSFICLPLTSRERHLGVIYFYRADRDTFTPEEIDLLATFASLAAQGIENARLYAYAQEQARTDALTGLDNRREFQRRLGEEIERARRNGRPLSLLMLDIDHFKRVNDEYGHLAGDAVLRDVSKLLGSQVRSIDRVCRYGGEEIAVILPETPLVGAANVAERMRAAVEAQPFDINADVPVHITVSIGIGCCPAQADSAQMLVAAADAAMYAAKQGGRNRVVEYDAQLAGEA